MKLKKFLFLAGIFLLILILARPSVWASAKDLSQENTPSVSDDYCLSCHDTPGLRTELPSGEELYVGVDPVTFYTSSHGSLGYGCVQCHTDINAYPHPENNAQTVREYNIEMYETCRKCHEGHYVATSDSTHQKALNKGNIEAAICTDCHGSHDIRTPGEPRSNIAEMCERCHSEIYKLYEQSVHGSALIGEGNSDVPTCTDCHGVHHLSGPSTNNSFHLFSPQICENCHANNDMMSKYDINTDVFDTYISDFHGTTVVLFEKITPDQDTNKPVCIDCHGVHDMRKVNDPESKVMKENLLTTCQKCHPEATANFPTSWLGHYKPSAEDAPLIFFVDLFYKIIIPVTIGGMLIFIGSDVGRKIVDKAGGKK